MNKQLAAGYGSLSAAERVFWNVYLFDLEVENGGLLQYFGNTEGEHAGDVIGALNAIGADETAARVQEFFHQVFPDGVPADAGARRELSLLVEEDYERFRAGDDALSTWYYQDTEKIFVRLRSYAGEHGFLID